MGEEALLPLRLFRVGVFSVGSAQSFVIGVGMFGGMASSRCTCRSSRERPDPCGLAAAADDHWDHDRLAARGQITMRTGRYKICPIIGSALLVAGMALMATIETDTTLWHTGVYMLVFGLGLGLNMQSLVLAMQKHRRTPGSSRGSRAARAA